MTMIIPGYLAVPLALLVLIALIWVTIKLIRKCI